MHKAEPDKIGYGPPQL